MKLKTLVLTAKDKTKFLTLEAYVDFCVRYLDFKEKGLQAVIVSQNETNYRFYQYRDEGFFNITRPINADLMYSAADAEHLRSAFLDAVESARDLAADDKRRALILRGIYTIQQCIGAALDALPANESNTARKINGDLFERFVQLIIQRMGIDCLAGTVQVPVIVDGEEAFKMSYQHDLLIKADGDLKAIGSVKTSSKDRIDKIFLDKFLYCKLTETAIPHIAIFLNDVQRKPGREDNEYGVNSTFLTGHFKGFTVKLNPLDGVYYCDIRPNMKKDPLLKQHIKTIDHLLCRDIWKFVDKPGLPVLREWASAEGVVEEVKPVKKKR